MNKCLGLMGEIFGHNFKVETILGPVDLSGFSDLKVRADLVDSLRPVHEVVVVCKRCGCAPERGKS